MTIYVRDSGTGIPNLISPGLGKLTMNLLLCMLKGDLP